MFEWYPGIPILDDTKEEAPYIINEYELNVENVANNDDENGQREDENERVLNII